MQLRASLAQEKLEKENENLLKKKDECTRDADWERLGKAGI